MRKSETICVHPDLDSETKENGVTSTISPSTAYNYMQSKELVYPGFFSTYNQKRLGNIVAELEGGAWGLAFSSGMSAITTAILSFVKEGDHIIFFKELYGGTWKLATEELTKRGISCSFVNADLESFERSVQLNTRLIYVETPSNPLLTIVDLKSVSNWAQEKGLISIIDNTFATPINQQPILLGFDIVVHSGTKYLGGHNDLPFGVLIVENPEYRKSILSTAILYGGSLSPVCCYQAERSMKTLALRVERQNFNAQKVALFLNAHPQISKVYYPGLTTHYNHEIARKQMKGFGGMLSFVLKGNEKDVQRFLKNLNVIKPALSLGGVESLICVPAHTSHSELAKSIRESMGISDNLLRLSVGIEDADDLIYDLATCLNIISANI